MKTPWLNLSLFSKILLSTSLSLTAIFGAVAILLQQHALRATSQTLEEEADVSLASYETFWNARRVPLAMASNLLAGMSDVRAAFGTRDPATIRDTAAELWSRTSGGDAFFLVLDANGATIASLGGTLHALEPGAAASILRDARASFPRQASGLTVQNGRLLQVVVTPVYVESATRPLLLNVLLSGYEVDDQVAQQLKKLSAGSEFIFRAAGHTLVSTLDPDSTKTLQGTGVFRAHLGSVDYLARSVDLTDLRGHRIGDLFILRSFAGLDRRMSQLNQQIALIWVAAMILGFILTALLARHILRPVRILDRAVAEIARQNYQTRVDVPGGGEFARLAAGFNEMSSSIDRARTELVRQERISTIGRLAASIVHDLRNPLAAIYGGAEMLVDQDLPEADVKRLAGNIYRSSIRIRDLLQDLVDISRGHRPAAPELCHLSDLLQPALDAVAASASAQQVTIDHHLPQDLELTVERDRVERVITNLLSNALEAMPTGGVISLAARPHASGVEITVSDTGPGIPPEIRDRLFEPFVSAGKRNGLGLGLALARQTVQDQGGRIWLDAATHGTSFHIWLPLQP